MVGDVGRLATRTEKKTLLFTHPVAIRARSFNINDFCISIFGKYHCKSNLYLSSIASFLDFSSLA